MHTETLVFQVSSKHKLIFVQSTDGLTVLLYCRLRDAVLLTLIQHRRNNVDGDAVTLTVSDISKRAKM